MTGFLRTVSFVGLGCGVMASLAFAADNGLPPLPGEAPSTAIRDTGKTLPPDLPPAPPAKQEPAAAPVAAAPAPAQETVKIYSFGSYPYSLFFTGSQVTMMRLALTTAENRPGVDTVEAEAVKDANVPAAPSEPASYPVFFMNSIVYHSPTDWAVWVSGKKITPQTNPTDIKIVTLDNHQATFSWLPNYQQALIVRNAQHSFAPTTKVAHRLAARQGVSFNETTGTVTFTLRPNQSFAAGYMSVFEGSMQSPGMPPASGMPTPAPASNAVTIGDGGAAGGIENTLAQPAIDKMLSETK